MKRLLDSIYTHLTLVLLLALSASFATMYLLFSSHLREARTDYFIRSLAAQVRLAEELVKNHPKTDITRIEGLRISDHEPKTAAVTDVDGSRRLQRLRERLTKELHRHPILTPSSPVVDGFWIDLQTDPVNWLFIPIPDRNETPGNTLEWVLLVGFAVFFSGGMALLWGIQRPLNRLSRALDQVGQGRELIPLPLTGGSEIRSLTKRYNEMVERLHRFEEERATMLAGVAHDLRSPITRLRLLLALVQHPRDNEIVQNLDAIEQITEQFLDAARGRSDETPSQADMALFIAEVSAPYADHQVSSTCGEGGIVAGIYPSTLRRGLINLIENAIEYGRPPITVSLDRTDAEIVISVRDHGRGIDPTHISQALRPFSRLDPSRGGKGHCGLGLVIAAKAAEQHRGRIAIFNHPEGGLVAEIHLPAEEAFVDSDGRPA
ncbi:MAG: HAMP domain-containing protein [Gammaproteobacteria bacterium]|nr:HAMP domain-containing protein [Gammaproteobacteria bacterium]